MSAVLVLLGNEVGGIPEMVSALKTCCCPEAQVSVYRWIMATQVFLTILVFAAVPYFQAENVTLYLGDAREILPEIEPVDLVFTDPPYPHEFDHVWDILAEEVPAAMKEGGNLLTYCGHYQVPRVMDALRKTLSFHWLCIQNNAGGINPIMHGFGVKVNFKPVLWFRKGRWVKRSILDDNLGRLSKQWSKKLHPWAQPMVAAPILKLTPENGTVLDPFAGSGTTLECARLCGRMGIGIEIDERTCEKAATRLSQSLLSFGDDYEPTKTHGIGGVDSDTPD